MTHPYRAASNRSGPFARAESTIQHAFDRAAVADPNALPPSPHFVAIQKILASLNESIPEISGAVFVREAGAPVVHGIKDGPETSRLSTLAVAISILGREISGHSNSFGQISIDAGESALFVCAVTSHSVLTVIGPPALAGWIRIETESAAGRIRELITRPPIAKAVPA